MTLDEVARGGKAAMARALARLEARPDEPEMQALLDAAWRAPIGHAIGLTGPPGVGKSTLIDAMIRHLRAEGVRVAVIAVDPSSRRSGGALLGDRTRLRTDPEDQGVFVRSMAAGSRLGGLSAMTFPALVLMRALYDVVLIETVGVGQSETEIADMADTVVLCAQPGAGDALQFMKAGVTEIPHLALVTKADMGGLARRAAADLKAALSLAAPDAAEVAVLACSAATGEGVAEALATLRPRLDGNSSDTAVRRVAQMRAWARHAITSAYGAEGFARVEGLVTPEKLSAAPFWVVAEAQLHLKRALDVGFRQR
jgi:LAO/AO transport system kinase